MAQSSHYPQYNVMQEEEAWDDHTREIVKKRLSSEEPEFLKPEEITTLAGIVATLIDDSRREIISFVINHIDQQLKSKIGESERKEKIPPEDDLIRKGLALIDQAARDQDGSDFAALSLQKRQELLGELERGVLQLPWGEKGFPQKELFTKLLRLSVESYFSHPIVWSEIGYGGPAYPRGYVRTELGLRDPWEAKWEE